MFRPKTIESEITELGKQIAARTNFLANETAMDETQFALLVEICESDGDYFPIEEKDRAAARHLERLGMISLCDERGAMRTYDGVVAWLRSGK